MNDFEFPTWVGLYLGAFMVLSMVIGHQVRRTLKAMEEDSW